MPGLRSKWIIVLCVAALLCAAFVIPGSIDLLAMLTPPWLLIAILVQVSVFSKSASFVPPFTPIYAVQASRPPPTR